MKKFTLMMWVLMMVLTGCTNQSSFDAEKLIGSWKTSETAYEDGIKIKTVITVTFSADKSVEFKTKYYAEDIYFGSMTAKGEYKISNDKIKVNIPNSNIDIKLVRDFFDSTSEYKRMVKEMREEFIKENEPWMEDKIISLTDTKMQIEDEDDGLITFKKIK